MDEWMGELDVCAPFSLSLSLSLSLFSRHGPPFLSFFPASARCVAVRLLMQRSAEGTEGEEDGSTREEEGGGEKVWRFALCVAAYESSRPPRLDRE